MALHEGWEQLAVGLRWYPWNCCASAPEIWSMNSPESWDVRKPKTELQGSSAGDWEAGAGDPSLVRWLIFSLICVLWAVDMPEHIQQIERKNHRECICIKAQDGIWCTWPSPAVGRGEWVSMNTVWAVELSCCWFMFES